MHTVSTICCLMPCVLVKARVRNHIELKRYRDQLENLVHERTHELANTQEATIESMGTLAECRDPETGGHIRRTRGFMRLLAEGLAGQPAHAAALGQPLPEVSVTDAKARWGSCKQAHRGQPAQIRYSWRLILAPPAVLDYVAAHECAHLIEANHGPDFWAINARLHPALKTSRAWLKTHGQRLHAAGQG